MIFDGFFICMELFLSPYFKLRFSNGKFVAIKTQYGVEEYERYEPCSHKPAGVDYICKTPVYKSYKCSRCGAATNTTSYSYRVECRGLYAK